MAKQYVEADELLYYGEILPFAEILLRFAPRSRVASELKRIKEAATLGTKLGIQLHADHGFDYENVRPVAELERGTSQTSRSSSLPDHSPLPARLPLIEEYNIGHSIVCRAALVGLGRAVREMVSAIRAP